MKFERAERKIGSAMKSVGEVMGIGRTFPEAFQKAMRMTGRTSFGFRPNRPQEALGSLDKLADELANPTDARIFAVARAMYANQTVEWIAEHSRIDKWFLWQLERVYHMAKHLDTLMLNEVDGPWINSACRLCIIFKVAGGA